MRKIGFAALGLGLALTALVSQPRRAEAQVCNLLCIQGYHCCLRHGDATCVPESEPCHP